MWISSSRECTCGGGPSYLGRGEQEDRYGALVIRREGRVRWIQLATARELEPAIDTYDNIVRGSYQASLLPGTLRGLYDIIMKPVLSEVRTAKRLVLSPDGALNFIAFATLLAPSDRFLGDDYLITYMASARHLLRPAATQPRKNMVIYANPLFRNAKSGQAPAQKTPMPGLTSGLRFPVLEPLLFTDVESKDVKQIAEHDGWSVTVRSGRAATEQSLYEMSAPGILHLATHGFLLPETGTELQTTDDRDRGPAGVRPVQRQPSQLGGITSVRYMSADQIELDDPLLRNGVALVGAQDTLERWRTGQVPVTADDGVLNGAEAAMLDLKDTWLVTLSSCDSGRGDPVPGEGVFGLRRGFLIAGAANVLTTLWPVNDEVTASMMKGFYTNALTTSDAPAALALVQRELLRRLRGERGLYDSVRLAGAFVITSQGPNPAAPK